MKAEYNGLEIAIVGISGHFPGSKDHRAFWKNLEEGNEMIRTFTDDELLALGMSETELQDPRYVKSVGALDNKDLFDHGFFGYTPEEASLMDPQIRLFHQQCWKALDDAGYSLLVDKKKIGLFAGASENNNWKLYVHSQAGNTALDPYYVDKISNSGYLSTLIAYKLNFTGISLNISTACSTSLVALDLACRSLLTRECTMALAGGISMGSNKRKGYYYQEGSVASIDGHCRAFDVNSSGTATGEGSGVVVLKRLSEAIKDKDHIYAVIRSSASNNDGNNKVGYTAPSVKGQSDCIRMTHKLAGVDPKTITYVEAHGTATRLGDPIEIRSLNEAFGVSGNEKFCAIGSVKTNIGHLDSAAGIAGLIKTALSLKHKKIPASLNYTAPNPQIDFAGGPFYVNTTLQPWVRNQQTPLRAGISSFGIGGTNAHVLLEEAPAIEKGTDGRPYKILSLSAKTGQSLTRYMHELKTFLQEESEIDMADVSYTLHVGRKHFGFRKSIAYTNKEELMLLLDKEIASPKLIKSKGKAQVVFMFPGQGTQYAGMGKELYEENAFFRNEMDRGFALLQQLTGHDFKAVLFTGESARLNSTNYTQPLLFVLEHALSRLLMSYDVTPSFMIGHSIGEYVAACISGVFSYEDALRLVVKRGQLMNSLPAGSMLSVPISETAAKKYLRNGISIAAVNGPEQIVFSGDLAGIEALSAELNEAQVACVKLHTSHAFHSSMQDAILEDFKKELEKTTFHKPAFAFISNITGSLISDSDAVSPAYWVKHLRETVRFSNGIKTLQSLNKEMIFVEVGAGNSLSGLLKQHTLNGKQSSVVNLIKHIKEETNDNYYLADKLGQLWSLGVVFNWQEYYKDENRRRTSLPAYSFDPVKYPAEVDPFEKGFFGFAPATPASESLKDWIYFPVWKNTIRAFKENDAAGKNYLFFSQGNAFTGKLAALLSQKSKVVEVVAGETYIKQSPAVYTINAANKSDYIALLNDLQKDGINISGIIHSWGIDATHTLTYLNAENQDLYKIYFSITYLVQALLKTNTLSGKQFTLITNSLHPVIGNEVLKAGQSLALGLVNVLPQEYSVSCRNIDINLDETADAVIIQLAEELNSETPERHVALRNGKRWVQEYQKNNSLLLTKQQAIKEGGLYLITGGLGQVGSVMAKHLITKYNAKVVIMGRRTIDSNNAKEEYTTRLKELEALSKHVLYMPVDVVDKTQFAESVARVNKTHGRIDGVIHTAGNKDWKQFELIADISVDNALQVLAPKVSGIQNIAAVFSENPPDFVWATSSIASILGGLSFGSYSAANLYLDYFINAKPASLNWKSINLGEMWLSEQEANKPQGAFLGSKDIVELFEWSLTGNAGPQVIATAENLALRLDKVYGTKKEVYLDTVFDVESVVKLSRPDLSNEYVAPETEVQKKLVEMIESLFGIENIGIEDNFFELGGDSLKAMMLLKKVEFMFNIKLQLNDFFKAPTIKGVAAEIENMDWLKADVDLDKEIII